MDKITIVGSIVGSIGGVLGLFTFIDNYLLKFKPKFQISNTVYFKFSTSEKYHKKKAKTLECVMVKIEIFNKRNKIGRIDDFALRIYNPSSTLPHTRMFFAENEISKFPSLLSELVNIEKSPFTPVSVLNKSSKQVVIEFHPDRHMYSAIDPSSLIKIDLLYKNEAYGWQLIGSYNPYNLKDKKFEQTVDGFVAYSLIDATVSRKNAEKVLKEPKTSLYKGISGKYLGSYLAKPYYLIKRFLIYPVSFGKLFIAIAKLVTSQAFSHLIILPLIKNKSKKIERLRFRPARSHLIELTDQSLQKIKRQIESIIQDINQTAGDDAKINITEEKNSFQITRAKFAIKFYKSGDGFLTVQDTGGHPQLLYYKLELYEYPFRIKLWKVNNRVMSIKTTCITIMDSFILLAH